MRSRAFALVLILALATFALAGCSGAGQTPSTDGNPSAGTSSTNRAADATGGGSTATPTSSGSSPPTSSSSSPQQRILLFSATPLNGTAPLPVNFTVTAQGESPVSFRIEFGDGASHNGTTLPATVAHTFATGNFVTRLTATYGDGSRLNRSLTLTALAPIASEATLYERTFTATLPISLMGDVVDFVGCGWHDAIDEGQAGGVICYDRQMMSAYRGGLNKTYLVGYSVPVPVGAQALFVEGGSKAAQTCDPTGEVGYCAPDMDLYAFEPGDVAHSFASGAAFESGTVENPVAGTWTILIVYYFGAPNTDASVHIRVT